MLVLRYSLDMVHLPGKQRMMEVVVTTGLLELLGRAKLQSNHHHQHPVFYSPDALPVAQPTVSKH